MTIYIYFISLFDLIILIMRWCREFIREDLFDKLNIYIFKERILFLGYNKYIYIFL